MAAYMLLVVAVVSGIHGARSACDECDFYQEFHSSSVQILPFSSPAGNVEWQMGLGAATPSPTVCTRQGILKVTRGTASTNTEICIDVGSPNGFSFLLGEDPSLNDGYGNYQPEINNDDSDVKVTGATLPSGRTTCTPLEDVKVVLAGSPATPEILANGSPVNMPSGTTEFAHNPDAPFYVSMNMVPAGATGTGGCSVCIKFT